MVESEKIKNVTKLLKMIAVSEIFLVYINKESDKFYLRYYTKQHTSSFYIGILTNTLGEAKIKLVHIMKLVKKAQTKKNKDDYLIVIDNDVKLLSEVDFEEDINLLANG